MSDPNNTNHDQVAQQNLENLLPFLTREQILGAQDIKVEPVSVPEWGGRVYVRTLSGTQREKYVESIRRTVGKGKKATVEVILAESGAKLVAQTLCLDSKGTPMFPEAVHNPSSPLAQEAIKKLGEKSSRALQRVIDASAKLNGLSDEAEEEAKNDSESETTSDSSID